VIWAGSNPYEHSLLAKLGPEPLADSFSVDYLYARSRGKRLAIKQFIMDGHVVVGVGNIYANESLFLAGIHPSRQAGRIGRARIAELVAAIKVVIGRAIEQGGTTLRDFTRADGKPGYFKQELAGYGRGGLACIHCHTKLKERRHNNRATVYCPNCQT
jgi:formamidopyrimidine-DNA glycosylase